MPTEKDPRILIVTNSIPPAFSGAGLLAYRHAIKLHKKKRLAYILTTHRFSEDDRWMEGSDEFVIPNDRLLNIPSWCARDGRVRNSPLKYLWLDWIKLPILTAWNLFRYRKSYEAIHCFGAGSMLALYSIGVASVLGKKTVNEMTLLGFDDPITVLEKSPIKIMGKFRYWLYGMADHTVSISPALTSAYENSGLDRQRLREVYNPTDMKKFRPADPQEKKRLRRQLGLSEDRPIFLFVGAIIHRKGVDFLIEAFSDVAKKHAEALLLLIGPTDTDARKKEFTLKMKRRIEELGLENQVEILGLKDNVDEYMRASDCFVFPSRQEGFGTVVTEAMSSGLPAIATNIPGITEMIVTHDHDGLIVFDRAQDKFTEYMLTILEDGQKRETLACNAIEKVKTTFSDEVIDRQYDEIYRS